MVGGGRGRHDAAGQGVVEGGRGRHDAAGQGVVGGAEGGTAEQREARKGREGGRRGTGPCEGALMSLCP